jgi:hypothetical protein
VFEGRIAMTYDDQIKEVLNLVKKGELTSEPLPGMREEAYFSLIEDCESMGYIKTFMTQIVYRYMGGGHLANEIVLTKKGHDFLDGKEQSATGGQHYHIGTVTNSNVGNNGVVNNTYGISVDEVIKLIEQTVALEDRDEAKEIVATIQEEPELKPGMLKRFDTVLEKYPGLTDTFGRLVMTVLTS